MCVNTELIFSPSHIQKIKVYLCEHEIYCGDEDLMENHSRLVVPI